MMYRCTECNAEYEEYPDFCDCGNDEFEEISEEQENNSYKNEANYLNRDLTDEEKAIKEEDEKDKKKSLIAMGIIAILCIIVFILPPHGKNKIEQVKNETISKKIDLPSSIDVYWDDSLPDVPLLNERLTALSSELREYLIQIGRQLNTKWDTSFVKGTGECTVQLRINRQGGLDMKTIASSSGNQNLDDSVAILLTNTYGFRVPPKEYNGEKIYILFSLDKNGISKVSYPSYSKQITDN